MLYDAGALHPGDVFRFEHQMTWLKLTKLHTTPKRQITADVFMVGARGRALRGGYNYNLTGRTDIIIQRTSPNGQ
jgi:hypothetical protein